jgi:hypothetical protein
VAEALFDPDMVLFPAGLSPKDVEHFRVAHEGIVKAGGAIVRWDESLFGATWPPAELDR